MTSTNSSNKLRDETENLFESSNQINTHWINTAKERGRWTLLEENYTKNSGKRTRRSSHTIPARYVHWSETERRRNSRHHLTQWKNIKSKVNLKERVKMVSSSFLKAAAAPHSAPHALPNVASVSSRPTVKNIFDGRCLENNVMG